MDNAAKLKIKEHLQKYCSGYESNRKASATLKDVSPGTISQILNDKWDLISDKMWLNISKQVCPNKDNWITAETYNYKLVRSLLTDGKDNSRVHAIIGGAGWGKDTAAKPFAADFENVYLINCNEFFNKKYFMVELLRKMGLQTAGTVPEMMERAVRTLNKTLRPLIILNEVDKLKDETLYFFITLYNLCEDKCGIVIMATDQLEKRISRGMFLNKKGYQEIFSRIGRRYIELKQPSRADITAICAANDVTDPQQVSEVVNSSEGDLRRVKKLVQNILYKREDSSERAA